MSIAAADEYRSADITRSRAPSGAVVVRNTSRCVVSCRVVSCRVLSRRVVSRRVVSCHVLSRRVISCHVMPSQEKAGRFTIPDVPWCGGRAREDATKHEQRASGKTARRRKRARSASLRSVAHIGFIF